MDEDEKEAVRYHCHLTLDGLGEAGLSIEEDVEDGAVDADDVALLNHVKRKREAGATGGARPGVVVVVVVVVTLALTLALALTLTLTGKTGKASKVKLAKDPRDPRAASMREYSLKREEGRKKKGVDLDEERLAEDEAKIEEQRPGVMKNFDLWLASDGYALRGKLHYSNGELRTALTAKKQSDRTINDGTRPLPQLVRAVKAAYGFR